MGCCESAYKSGGSSLWYDLTFSTQKCKIDHENCCLICNECVVVLKDYNLWRHHIDKHQTFCTNFPRGHQERAAKTAEFDSILQPELYYHRTIMHSPRAAAPFRVSWILAKKKRTFTNSETVKDILTVVDGVISDNKIKTRVTFAIKNVSLSDTKKHLQSWHSSWQTDTAQLCIYVRCFDGL